jgi:DNA polymerase family A
VKQIVVDFETYYDQDYSLRKMTPVEYILDPRFECIGVAVKEDGGPAEWLTPDEFVRYLRGLELHVCMISHNALFDMCLLAWRFDYVPHLMIDTLGMARAWLGHELRSLSLDSVSKHLGMSLAAIKAAGIYDEYAEYSKDDADLCWQVYRRLVSAGFPALEIAVMDTVLRCAVEPRFQLNRTKLAEHLHAVQQGKETLLQRIPGGLTRDDLMSNDKFAEALRALGVDPPTKISMTTNKETYAFAKTDAEFIELEEHDDPDVQALVSARLGVKSTIEETRTQRLLNIASLRWPDNRTGLLPIPLRFSGAHTHRLSGDWKLNMQNLPSRGNTKIREAIEAPPGYKVVAVDASQIEARIAGWLCGATALTNAFANKEDVYSTFASAVFGYEVLKKTHPVERFIGKTAVLGLQYGLGWAKFQKTVAMQSKAQVGEEVLLDDVQAARVVQTYRNTYREIPRTWQYLNGMINRMAGDIYEEFGPLAFVKQGIKLPSGLYLKYHNLENRNGQWWFTYGGKPKYLYGGKMLENIVQALARICVMDAAVRVRKRTGHQLALQVHDELVYVVRDHEAGPLQEVVTEEMRRRPWWGPDIPLDAEGGIGQSYGEAK